MDPSSVRQSASAAADTAYEPFDARKRQRVADLITQEEKLLEDVANLKRTVPQRAAAVQVANLNESLKRDDEVLREVEGRDLAGDVRLEGLERLGRQEDVEEEFRRAVEVLGRLKQDMSTVVAKMERARVAGEYVLAHGR